MSKARRSALMKRAGPYLVTSNFNGMLTIYPEWPDTYNYEEDWGGPGIFSRAGLAADLQNWLNAPYLDAPPSQFDKLPKKWRGIHRLKREESK